MLESGRGRRGWGAVPGPGELPALACSSTYGQMRAPGTASGSQAALREHSEGQSSFPDLTLLLSSFQKPMTYHHKGTKQSSACLGECPGMTTAQESQK